MSMNLPKYSKEIAEAHDVFRGDVSHAHNMFEKAMMLAAENLDEKLRALRIEFFENDDDVPKEATSETRLRKFA